MAILVSIVMAVRNAQQYVGEAVESILRQTHSNLEVVLVDDASDDQSIQVVEGFRDPRIQVVRLFTHQGIPRALNRGLDLCKGKYIARLDADDVAVPERLALQVQFMERYPEVVVSGGFMLEIGGDRKGTIIGGPVGLDLGHYLLRGNMLKSSSVIMRRSTLEGNSLRYNIEYPNAQDYALWIDLSRVGQVANLPTVLGHYRRHEQQQTNNHKLRQRRLGLRAQSRMLLSVGSIRRYGARSMALGALYWVRNLIAYIRAAAKQCFRM